MEATCTVEKFKVLVKRQKIIAYVSIWVPLNYIQYHHYYFQESDYLGAFLCFPKRAGVS